MQYSSFLPVFGFRACSQVRNHRCGGAVESHRAGGHTSRRRRRSAVDQNLPGHKGLRHQLHFLAGVRSVEVASDHLQQAAILRSAQYQNIAKQPVGHLLEYFSIQKHHFSGAILHNLCVFNSKIQNKVGIHIAIRYFAHLLHLRYSRGILKKPRTCRSLLPSVSPRLLREII